MKTSSLSRRSLLGGFASFPLVAIASSPTLIAACGGKPPETPLAHLYGRDWVHGAYNMYAGRYADVQTSAESSSTDAYCVLAQKGIVALDVLQSRDVPFFIRVDDEASRFVVTRNVPERLMYTAEMSEADRKNAEVAWKRAREFVHADYEEIRRLDWTLARLFGQLQRVRNAIDEGQVEQYRIVEQLARLSEDPKKVPYELPYQVSTKDYEEILLLLLERLEDDRKHLKIVEADILVVGMTTRATDANSATLAASLRKVLLAIVEDGQLRTRSPLYPESDEERAKYLAAGKALRASIERSAEFATWKKAEADKRFAALGVFLQTLDRMTGLPTSAAFKTVLDVLRGERDYFTYLKTIVAFVPQGGTVSKVIGDALDYTEKARRISGTILSAANGSPDQALAQAKGAVINTGSRFAVERIDRQLSFYKEKAEVSKVTDLLAQTPLLQRPLPDTLMSQ